MTCEVCYLQDLFVDSTVRRQGCGAKLIEAVAAVTRERGCARLYWTTKEDNTTARSLYDRIARFNGFIRYDRALAYAECNASFLPDQTYGEWSTTGFSAG
jgi:ribosomal protein S18 acetylase RimI-like enzyme